MGLNYSAKLIIGKRLTEDEASSFFEKDDFDSLEILNSSEETYIYTKVYDVSDSDDSFILKLDIKELNELYNKSVSEFRDKAEIALVLEIS